MKTICAQKRDMGIKAKKIKTSGLCSGNRIGKILAGNVKYSIKGE